MDQGQLATYHGAIKKHERKSKRLLVVESTVEKTRSGVKILIIVRGMPGSGKSYLAKKIYRETVDFPDNSPSNHIFSADDYFCNFGRSPYRFDPSRLDEVHMKNQERAMRAMKNGVSPVIIDNTNIALWEFTPYVKVAVQHGYFVELVEPYTPWCLSEKQLATKNTHGVGFAKIKIISQKYWSQGELFGLNIPYMCGLSYLPQNQPPKLREFPPICRESGMPSTKEPIKNEKPSIKIQKSPEKNVSIKNDKIVTNQSSNSPPNDTTPTDTETLTEIINNIRISQEPKKTVEIFDSSTNTSSADFALATGRKPLDDHESANLKIISATAREIGPNLFPKTDVWPHAKLHLDKSSMTEPLLSLEESESRCCVESKHFQELIHMFPNIKQENLSYVFKQCGKNVNWAVDLLIDSVHIEIPLQNPAEVAINAENVSASSCQWCQGRDNEENDKKASTSPTPSNDCVKTKKEVKKSRSNEEISKIKRMVEEQFVIGDEHYSKHCLKIKNQRQGNFETEEPSAQSETGEPNAQTETEEPNAQSETTEVVADNSDDDSFESSEDDELVEVNVGPEFIQSLDKYFTGAENVYPKEVNSVISLPIALAHQLYAFWLDSFRQQMTVLYSRASEMIEKDAEFARQLQEKEDQAGATQEKSKVVNLQEIMDMEIALAIAKHNPRNEAPETLAMRLTKQNLAILFPEVSPQVIASIYSAHNNKYEETVQVLMDSLHRPPIKQEDIIKRTEQLIDEIKAQVVRPSIEVPTPETLESTQYYKSLAVEEFDLREKNIEKAKEMFNKGSYAVAGYYSDVANAHRQKFEKFHAMAMVALVKSCDKRQKATVDLHYLIVVDALATLDMFIDMEVQKLRESSRSWETLLIITGQGTHSRNNIPKIKPAVLKRLKQRGLRYSSLVNPGMFSTKIRKTTLLSTEI